jgi:hypothetical protein
LFEIAGSELMRGKIAAVTIFATLLLPYLIHAGYEEGFEAANKGLYQVARSEFHKAAVKGDARAQYSLGIMYFDGIGVKQDRKEAVIWLKKAADQGHKLAIEVLKRNQ